MAKDREKLFKGVDDKAITFQRAVFIVCNLKRLIKRPKKDEKQGGGSRKRSGAGGSSSGGGGDEDDDCASSGRALGSRGRKGQRGKGCAAKEPVRRAFTLPAMLCGTFGLAAPLPSTHQQQQRIGDQVSPSGEENPIRATANGPSTIKLQLKKLAREQQAGDVLNNPSGLGACDDEQTTSVVSPLSCLATPVRRALGTSNLPQQVCPDQDSSYSDAYQRSNYAPSLQTSMKRSFAGPEQSGAGQICCPVWLQLMNELDASQRQPRDQSQHAHLIGPPSPCSHLAAPVDAATQTASAVEPQVAVNSGSSEQPPQVFISGVGGPDLDEEARRQELVHQQQNQYRRSSDESAEKTAHRKHHHHQNQIGPDDCRKQAPGSPSSDVGPSGTQRMRQDKKNQTNERSDDRSKNHNANQQLLDIDQMRMKRFSSALCLNDQSRQSEGSDEQQPDDYAASGSRQVQAASHQQQATTTGAGRKATQAALLTPEDPTMTLARQRRPSASNQGSVNVEQQALFSAVECNQLERARSILEEGKANVNCLNGDKLTCLDIAVLMRHVEMVRLLQQYNAKESSAYLSREGRANQLYALYMEARRLVEDLSRSLQAFAPQNSQPNSQLAGQTNQPAMNRDQNPPNVPLMLATGSLLSTALFEEKQRQLQYWRRRLDLFMHMRYQFERLQVPNAPELIVLQVVGEEALGVKIVHSLKSNSSSSFANLHAQQESMHLAALGNAPTATAADKIGGNSPSQQQQQRLSAANAHQLLLSLPRCFQGPNCSHWHLAEFCAAADWQQQQIREQIEEFSSSSYTPGSNRSNDSRATRQLQQQQQQKLAVFNQLLAHQLKLLSYQQHQQMQMQLQKHLHRPLTKQPVMGGSSSDNESIGSHQSLEPNPVPDHHFQPQTNCPSIAYQLITSAGHLQRQSNFMYQQQHQSSIGGAGSSQACKDSLATTGGRIAGAVGGLRLCGGGGGGGDNTDSGVVIITKYKVEWSLNEQMDPILDSMIVYNNNLYPLECQISGLINGQLYYVQVSSGNHKGFCEPRPTSPVCLAPSSWRQVEGNKRRRCDEEVFRKFTKLILLNKHILDDHQACNSSLVASSGGTGLSLVGGSIVAGGSQQSKSNLINMLLLDATTPTGDQLRRETNQLQVTSGDYHTIAQQNEQQQSSTSMRKNLKNFFQSNSFKFHKLNNQNKRGLYLTTVVYYTAPSSSGQTKPPTAGALNQPLPSSPNDKIIVTNDDRLPIIEVLNDLVAPAALMSDFYWLLKINGTQWMDIKRLRQQLQKSHSSSTLHLRIKLLAAIEQMQLALNMEDIGRLFYKPIQAHDGSIVVCTCRRVPNTKMVSSLSIKWTHQHKIIPRHLRKISDSMLSTGEQSRASTSSETKPSARECRAGSQISQRTNLEPTVAMPQQQQPNGDFRTLCENCQYQLIHRRSTMASGSSNSSLASSNESQWSVSGVSNGCTLATAGCQCRSGTTSGANRSNSSITTVSGPSFLLSAPGSQRSSTCTGSTCTAATARSAGPWGTPTHQSNLSVGGGGSISLGSASISSTAGLSGRNSSQPFTSAQKSSTYLMLASLSLYDLLLFHMNEIIYFDQMSSRPLKRGLYLGFVQLQTTVESMRLLVPRARPNMVPNARIRDNAHVSREEWQLLKRFACNNAASINNKSPTTTALQNSATPTPTAGGDTSKPMHLDAPFVQTSESRNRAKSVSPGSIKAANEEAAAKANDDSLHMGQSRSSEQIQSQHSTSDASVNSLLRPTNHSISQQVSGARGGSPPQSSTASQAHSDTDLNLVAGRRRQRHLSQTATDASSQVASTTTAETIPTCSDPSLDLSLSPSLSFSQTSAVAAEQYKQLDSKAGSHRQERSSRGGSTSGSRVAVFTGGGSAAAAGQQTAEETFVRLVGSAARRLLAELSGQLPRVFDEQTNAMVSILQSLNDEENNRIYHLELIELSNQVSFILLIPAPENVCPVTSHEKSNILGDNKEYMLLPLQIFETIHINTYEPDLLGKYSRLSAILETDLVVAQHDHRQAFSSNELKSTKSRVSNLQEMVTIADEFWRKLRWIVDVVSFARDKSQNGSSGIKLGTIWRYFELTPSSSYSYQHTRRCSNASSGSQLQVVAEPKAGPRAGLEVKRTASAKTTGGRLSEADLNQRVTYEEKAASLTVMDSVPEIHLPMTGWQQDSSVGDPGKLLAQTTQTQQAQMQCPASAIKSGDSQSVYGRRHSGGPAVGATTTCRTILGDRQVELVRSRVQKCVVSVKHQNTQEQAAKQSISDSMIEGGNKDRGSASSCQDNLADCDESLIDLQLLQAEDGGSEDEENAIYAYHLSLKDATRAAAQRKCSQQSTRPIVPSDEVPTSTTNSQAMRKLSREKLELQHQLLATSCDWAFSPNSSDVSTPSSSSHSSQRRHHQNHHGQHHHKQTRPSTALSRGGGDKESGDNSSGSGSTIRQRSGASSSGSRKRGQFKSTNPFLSDSFDLVQENQAGSSSK